MMPAALSPCLARSLGGDFHDEFHVGAQVRERVQQSAHGRRFGAFDVDLDDPGGGEFRSADKVGQRRGRYLEGGVDVAGRSGGGVAEVGGSSRYRVSVPWVSGRR